MGDVQVGGTGWSGNDDGRYAGRFPLAVERHTLHATAELLPGITTVTPHARYYTLHGLIAAEAVEQGHNAAESMALLRRCEVALAAVTLAHGPHPGWSAPHGASAIEPQIRAGVVDVDTLSAVGGYSTANRGFLGPYLGSELGLGLVRMSRKRIEPGPNLDTAAVRTGIGAILDLARQRSIRIADLEAHSNLCLCQAGQAADGEMLRRLLLAEDDEAGSAAIKRSQTIRMMQRLMELAPSHRGTAVWPFLVYGADSINDPVLSRLQAASAWRGVVLRAQTANAWRQLWAWMINSIAGYEPVSALVDRFADALPDETVAEFRTSLPDIVDEHGYLAAAEISDDVRQLPEGARQLAVAALGAARCGTLGPDSDAYYSDGGDALQELTPQWLADELAVWNSRSTRDFGRHLTRVMIARSQRIAFRKARFKDGMWKVPTRVAAADGMIWRDSAEFGGSVGLRWDQLASVMAGTGILHRLDGCWRADPSPIEVPV